MCLRLRFVRENQARSRRNSARPPHRVSVIIPARNEEKNLPHVLDSLRKQTYAPHEIIVVDVFVGRDRTDRKSV
jgi:cellulose synthase/poly-beta-1,6-N-acetylglucosamine synthase-like glycosyltransferase